MMDKLFIPKIKRCVNCAYVDLDVKSDSCHTCADVIERIEGGVRKRFVVYQNFSQCSKVNQTTIKSEVV
jgi:hypothetical protein